MAVDRFYEAQDSRNDLNFGAQGGGVTARYHAIGSDEELEVYIAALVQSPLFLLGFVRQDIKPDREGPRKYKVHVRYGTTGLGGGDVPTGAGTGGLPGPANPTSPAGTQPLGAGYSFSTTGGTVHITQSLDTISATALLAAPVQDFANAIGVTDKGVEGVDIPAPSLKWSRTVARALVTREYLRTLRDLTGKVNNAEFYSSPAGEVRYLGAEGRYTSGEGWSITHHFEESPNEVNIEISDALTVAAKDGWDYLWVAYQEGKVGDRVIPEPVQANVERVSKRADFSALEIGTSGGS